MTTKAFASPPDMLQWQRAQILWELGEVQRHYADPNCPCNLADKGEYCLPKHCLALSGLASETAAMVTDKREKGELTELQAEAWDKHVALKDRIVCGHEHKDEGDVVAWARKWRKVFEGPYYHSCPVRAPVHAHLHEPNRFVCSGHGTNSRCHKAIMGGITSVPIGVSDVDKTKLISLDAVVDTGATYTTIPERVAQELKLPLKRVQKVQTADGRISTKNVYLGHINIKGEGVDQEMLVDGVTVVGVITLEVLGFRVNPVTHELERYTPIQYANLAAHLHEPQAVATIRVSGNCKAGMPCVIKVKGSEPVTKSTVSAGELPQVIAAVEKELAARKGKPFSAETFAIGPSSLTRYDLRHRLVEADKLITSHNPQTFALEPGYPQELQPRMRDRAATQAQVLKIAANIDPESLLVDFHSIDRGSPIVGADLIVESGNGRVMAVKRAITDAPQSYARYRVALLSQLAQFGLSEADAKGLKHPVLVRERLTKVERRVFAQEANTATAMSSSAVETARTDAKLLSLENILSLEVAEGQGIEDALRSPGNRAFVRVFLGKLPDTEGARMVDAAGVLNQDGVRRLALGVFVRSFPGDTGLRLAQRFFESTDPTVRNVLNGIARSLGKLAQAEALVAAGDRNKGLGLADDLAQAVEVFANIKATPGMTVEKYLSQGQLGPERMLSPFQERLLSEISARARSGKAIGEMLAAYAQVVIDSPPPQQAGMFPGAVITKAGAWETALRRATPGAVLAESTKQPWEMTQRDFAKPERITTSRSAGAFNKYAERVQEHKWRVQKALSEGKPIPPEVLADYPDLAQAKPVAAPEAAPVPRPAAPPARVVARGEEKVVGFWNSSQLSNQEKRALVVKAGITNPAKVAANRHWWMLSDNERAKLKPLLEEQMGAALPPAEAVAPKAAVAPCPIVGRQARLFQPLSDWQRTQAEYIDFKAREAAQPFSYTGDAKEEFVKRIKRQQKGILVRIHHQIVATALARGDPVPARVLKDYPDLTVRGQSSAQHTARIGPKTFAFSDEVLREMLIQKDKTLATKKEHGFLFCGAGGAEHMGLRCKGAACSIRVHDCAGLPQTGKFHTHPTNESHLSVIGSPDLGVVPSGADVLNSITGQVDCVGNPFTDKVNCWTRKEPRQSFRCPGRHVWSYLPTEMKEEFAKGYTTHNKVCTGVREAFDFATINPKEMLYGATPAPEGQKKTEEKPQEVKPPMTKLLPEYQIRLLEPLSKYIDKCNLSPEDEKRVWAFRPLRDFILWATGIADVAVCQAGMVPGAIQVTVSKIRGPAASRVNLDAEVAVRAKSVPGMKEIFIFGEAQRVFTVVLPSGEVAASELLGGKQVVVDRPFVEAVPQGRLFEPRRPSRCVLIHQHDDGDQTLKCKDGLYVKTTDGKVFKEIPYVTWDTYGRTAYEAKRERLKGWTITQVKEPGIALSPCEKAHHLGPKLERCILKVKAKGGAVNPIAVCRASVSRPVCNPGKAKVNDPELDRVKEAMKVAEVVV